MLDEQDKGTTKVQRLESEDRQWLAEIKSEKLAQRQANQERCRKIDCLEDVKKLNAAKT